MPLAFPKPTPLVLARREKKQAREAHWQAVKRQVRRRDGGKCRITTVFGRHEGAIDVHHVQPRSLGRVDSTENCLCACRFHHSLFKAGVLAVDFLTTRGCDGMIRLFNPREENLRAGRPRRRESRARRLDPDFSVAAVPDDAPTYPPTSNKQLGTGSQP